MLLLDFGIAASVLIDNVRKFSVEELKMGSLANILGYVMENGETATQALVNVLLGLDNLGANLFGSLGDTFGGISGSFDAISFAPAVVAP
ncbi:hypothetical protein C7T36_05540 [Rhodococcus sp. AD45-ID]|nr:hypothetical protein C7T36_05540 [Rhodococcus sp. AD45-ID]